MALLAHLYPHIRGSQEDIATLSLQYLLTQSIELNRAFTKRLSEIVRIDLEETLQYSCQVVGKGEEKERPDMVGVSSQGNEQILCEMKFYASLTENQPLTYLDRLKNNNGKGLVFICPASRQTSLWAKLQELCNGREIDQVACNCISVDGVALGIVSWTEIIYLLEQVASATAIAYSSDVLQLKEYCNLIDSEAFIPFEAEDLSAEMANKCERYYQVIDEVIDLLCADKNLVTSKNRLKATGYRKGYTRSLYINELSITLNYDRDLWKRTSTVETPFWVAIRDKEWHQDSAIVEKLSLIPEYRKGRLWDLIWVALEPMQNATFSEVCEDLKNKILEYLLFVEQ